jgi:hypothetical protein
MYWRVTSYVLPAHRPFPLLTAWLARLLVVAGAFVTLWRWREVRSGHLALLALLAAMSGSFMWAGGVAGAELTNSRHTIALLAPSVLFAFAVVDAFGSQQLRRLWVMTIVMLGLANMAVTYAPMAKTGDWKRVASHLMASEEPGQPIATFIADNALPLRYYYAGPNKIVAIPREQNFATYDQRASALNDEQEVRTALSNAGADSTDIWLITSALEPFLDVDVHPEILERFIKRCYATKSDQSFFRSRVRFLQRLPECSQPPSAD